MFTNKYGGDSMAKWKDLTGQRFGKLTAVSYAGKQRWNCICDCGNEKTVHIADLGRTVNSCGCLRAKDLTGQRFGSLVVIKRDYSFKGRGAKWICVCDCGNVKSILSRSLLKGATTSCGCSQLKDKTGERFGRLVVLKRSHGTFWECLCDCGNVIEVNGSNLISGNTTSCGCYSRDMHIEILTTHGRSDERLYGIWKGMFYRCNNENATEYHNYGGRGIAVCEEWENIENFIKWAIENGYKETLTLDRIDVNGNYCPENCRWATMEEQSNNKRTNVHITHNGETMTIAQWSRRTGIPYGTLSARKRRGWSDAECIDGKKKHK